MLLALIQSLTLKSLLVGVAVFLAAILLLRKRYKLPPGPIALPIIGNVLAFRSKRINEVVYNWSKRFGPVITIYFATIRCVVVNSVDTALEVLVKKSGDFAGRPNTYTLFVVTDGGKDIVMADYGPIWKLQRRLGMKALKQYLSGERLSNSLEGALDTASNLFRQQKGAFDPFKYITYMVHCLLCGVVFGKRYDINDQQFLRIMKIFEEFAESFGKGFWEDVIPPLRLMPTNRFRKLMKYNRELADIIQQHIEEHKAAFNPDDIRDMTDSLLLAMSEDGEFNELAEDDVYLRQTITDLFTAGIDTSRQTLTFAIFHLAAFPEIQAKVHQEVDEALGARRFPTLVDRPNLVYTEAALHETMRLSTVVPMGVPHKATRDTTIGDYEVPAGTMVMINHWAIHHDPAYWSDPENYRPERFLDVQGQLAQKPPAWLPFSAGRRVCLGETVARPELLLLLAGLLRNFHFAFPPGEKHDMQEARGSGFQLLPPTFNVIAKPRN